MTPPLTIPLSAADRPVLDALVARLWPAEARQAGVDPRIVDVEIDSDGHLYIFGLKGPLDAILDLSARAIDALCDALRDHGLVLDQRRVVGWAACRVGRYPGDGTHMREGGLVRILDLDGLDRRRIAHEDATTAARLARDAAAMGPPVADAKREHGIAAARAARRAGR